ncbi:septation initiation network scaffold protein cdc11 [Blastomyces dermatitidis ATCC 18188]|uniref:Septation initiation network scaffold protein cdc11 n=1 Tax=Ajellomyces dermatitidis (strain ATCC 18188 / CBS 674.68) TaxID=653446 RepID=F2T844_AJEDA|nr:septation initiation network scaffold protein cdc11 [Blastomyces dermatitidis ATCC 18188]
MSKQQPWLDGLSEDWVSQTSSLRDRISNSFKRSSRGLSASPPTSVSSSHNKPSFFFRHLRKTSEPSRLSDLEGNSNVSSNHTFSMINVFTSSVGPKVSVQVQSENTPVESSTMHIRPQSKHAKEDNTPEWKKRLARGEAPMGEGGDLFGPMELENVFRPPPTNTESNARSNLFTSVHTQANRPWSLPRSSSSRGEQPDILPNDLDDARARIENSASDSQDSIEKYSTSLDDAKCWLGGDAPANGTVSFDPRSRTVSGREELRNEEITPILFSRDDNDTVGEYTNREILESLLEEVRNSNLKETFSDSRRRNSVAGDDCSYLSRRDNHTITGGADDTIEMTSQSLPEDLSVGTMDFGSTGGGFVSTRRGGYSNDGSFRRRQLSPTSLLLSPLHSSSFLSNSKIRSSPPIDRRRGMFSSHQQQEPPPQQFLTPHRARRETNDSRPRSSGSPLKLFGEYDTFTSNKLLRRMSQFEETFNNGPGEATPSPTETRQKGRSRSRSRPTSRRNPNQAGTTLSSQSGRDTPTRSSRAKNRNPTNPKDHLAPNIPGSSEQRVEGLSLLPAPSLVITNEDGKSPSGRPSRRREAGKQSPIQSARWENDPFASSPANAFPAAAVRTKLRTNADDAAVVNENCESNPFRQSETKRVFNSPTKDPCRKRRRTLQNIDPNNQILASSLLESTQFSASYNIQNYQNEGQLRAGDNGDSELPPRPRTPTPSQIRSQLGNKEKIQTKHASKPSASLNAVQYEQNEPEQKLSFIATPSHVFDDSRKGSITTQDFLNEATKIMDIIRARGGGKHNHGLSSVEETNHLSDAASDVDYSYDDAEEEEEESTQEAFSRPPSREGTVDLRRLHEPRTQHPRIVSHLKKFEDKDDFELYMGGSVMSLRLDREQNVATYAIHRQEGESDGVESSPKNIRIRGRSTSGKRATSSSSNLSNGSNGHSGPSSQREISSLRSTRSSLPTGSSRGSSSGSGAKGIISSDMIAHLIPEQVGAMTYDRSAHAWVKGRDGMMHAEERPPASKAVEEDVIISEEDPFKDIPDLSVDELQELMATQTFSSPATAKGKFSSMTGAFGEGRHDGQKECNQRPPRQQDEETDAENRQHITDFRPNTRDGGRFETSSVQSKSTRFTSSCPNPETRATSWGSEELVGIPQPAETNDLGNCQKGGNGQPPPGERRGRVATISFSSPLVSHVAYREDSLSPVDPEHALPSTVQHDRYGSSHFRDSQNHPGVLPRPYNQSSPFRNSSRQNSSFGSRTFRGRRISRIDEQTEVSANDDPHTQHHGLSVIEALGHEDRSMILQGSPNMDTSYSFQLASLSDFTLHQIDESMRLDVSYVAERTHPTSLRQVHGTYTLATQDLIKHITDTEPYEPYWEHLRQLNLRGKGLITLHRLNEFCSRLEELDASDNNVGQVSGVPSSIRTLRVPRNYLSNLTAWGHLSNLQYLDVSGNKLEDLDAFSGLVHLRSLKADGNRIRNIRGIMGLNGLLTLKVRGNLIGEIDFGEAELTRLIKLDLRDNLLTSVRNIGFIKTIEKLDLRGNRIRHFESLEVLHCLHSLTLSNNNIEKLNIGKFPNLHLLYADRNHLSTISGLDQCHYLDCLSLREQTLPSSPQQSENDQLPLIHLQLSAAASLRKLYLSSNHLSSALLAPSASVPSLQYLDIASCALESLPSTFGTSFPNLRVLNLNFNALSDISELHGLTRLGRVLLVGNRIARLRKLCQVLRSVGGRCGALGDVDLRGNPITVGFYPAPVTGSGRVWRDEKGALVGDGDVGRRRFKNRQGLGHGRDERQLQVRERDDRDEDDTGFPTLGGCTDIARKGFGDEVHNQDEAEAGAGVEIEIDDHYTVPPANVIADRKYVVHLDEATRLRRRVVELMVLAAAAGRLRVLNGLPIVNGCAGGSVADVGDEGAGGSSSDGREKGRSGYVRKDEVWRRLEELGVLKKKNKKKQKSGMAEQIDR